MRWSGFVVLGSLGMLYFALALESSGVLAGLGYGAAAFLFLASVVNLARPRK
jgi:hypothetical protein